jgi:hypothetical protein
MVATYRQAISIDLKKPVNKTLPCNCRIYDNRPVNALTRAYFPLFGSIWRARQGEQALDKSTRLASGLSLHSPFAAMLLVFYRRDDCLWDAT